MRIRHDQLDRWHQRDPERFTDAILARVRKRHPTYRQTDGMLRDSIRTGIARAKRNGLSSDREISEFVLIMFEIAPNFDQQPDIRRALDDTTLAPGARWERLFTPAFDHAWAEADRPGFHDAGAWFDHPVADPSPAAFPTPVEWAEAVARVRIASATPPGAMPREPSADEVRAAADDIRRRLPPRAGAQRGHP